MMVSADRLSTLCRIGASWFGNGYDHGNACNWMSGITPACGLRTKPTPSNTLRAHPGVAAHRFLDHAAAEVHGEVPRCSAEGIR